MQELEVMPEGCAEINVEENQIKNQKQHIFLIW